MQKNWLDIFNEIGRDTATDRQKPPEPTQTNERQIPSPPSSAAPQRRTEALTASARSALMDAIDTGKTARALELALRAIADLTGDRELLDFNAQSRAAMGEEWRRAYKVWATHAPRIRAAVSTAEAKDAYAAATDACCTIADGTGEDGLALGGGVLEMFAELFREQYDELKMPFED